MTRWLQGRLPASGCPLPTVLLLATMQASGREFDLMWLQMMTAHHEGAVEMAKSDVQQGKNAQAKKLAQTIIDTQQAEINEMKALLAR